MFTRKIITRKRFHYYMKLDRSIDADRLEFERNEGSMHKLIFGNEWLAREEIHSGEYPLHFVSALSTSKRLVEDVYEAAPPVIKFQEEVHGATPLHLACGFNHEPQVIDFLIEKYPDAVVVMTNDDDWLPIHYACRYNQLPRNAIRTLLEKSPESAMAKTKQVGLTPLHLACGTNQSMDVIQLLIGTSPGAVEMKSKNGWLPLHYACRHNHSKEAIEVLLNAYPDSSKVQTTQAKWTPLHLACANCQSEDVIHLLLDRSPEAVKLPTSEGWMPLHVACRFNFCEKVTERLIREYPNAIEHQSKAGWTPLHYACRYNRSERITLMLIATRPGAVNVRNENGSTPLDYARQYHESGEVIRRMEEVKSQEDRINRSRRNLPSDVKISGSTESMSCLSMDDRNSSIHEGGRFPYKFGGGKVTATEKVEKGSQGIVCKGVMQSETNREIPVAIKIYYLEHDWEVCKKEVEHLNKIPRHENVIEVLDFYEVPLPCYVMPWVAGGNLYNYLTYHGRFNEDEAVNLLMGIGEGIRHLHTHSIVHRDIKSLNIVLVEETGKSLRPVLVDFGFVAPIERGGAAQFSTAQRGSPLWMAPEMITENQYSEKTDMYSLGIVMWEILSGDKPYANYSHLRTDYDLKNFVVYQTGRPDLDKLRSLGVSQDYQRIVQLLWNPYSAARPTAEQFLEALRTSTHNNTRMPLQRAASIADLLKSQEEYWA